MRGSRPWVASSPPLPAQQVHLHHLNQAHHDCNQAHHEASAAAPLSPPQCASQYPTPQPARGSAVPARFPPPSDVGGGGESVGSPAGPVGSVGPVSRSAWEPPAPPPPSSYSLPPPSSSLPPSYSLPSRDDTERLAPPRLSLPIPDEAPASGGGGGGGAYADGLGGPSYVASDIASDIASHIASHIASQALASRDGGGGEGIYYGKPGVLGGGGGGAGGVSGGGAGCGGGCGCGLPSAAPSTAMYRRPATRRRKHTTMVTKAEFREVVASRSEGRPLDLPGKVAASPTAGNGRARGEQGGHGGVGGGRNAGASPSSGPTARSPKADAASHLRVVSVLLDEEELLSLQQGRLAMGLP